MEDAMFLINFIIEAKRRSKHIKDLYTQGHCRQDMVDLYEYMLKIGNCRDVTGSFRTPKHIRKMMVELIAIDSGYELVIRLANSWFSGICRGIYQRTLRDTTPVTSGCLCQHHVFRI